MVQKHSALIIFWRILLRIIFLIVVFLIAGYESQFAFSVLQDYLGYQTPDIFWGGGLVDSFISFELSFIFLSGILFGALGRKIDYLLNAIFIIYGLWDYNGTSTVTYGMFWGLVGAAIIGNIIGFVLKLLRQKFLPKLVV